MVKKIFLVIIIGLFFSALLAAVGMYTLHWYSEQPVNIMQEQDFTLEKGESLGSVARHLEKLQVISDARYFIVFVKIAGFSRDLHAGDYRITTDMSYGELLAMFVQGQVRYYSVTLVEGTTFYEALDLLNQQAKLSHPLQEEELTRFLQGLPVSGHPEGLFYPDTYYFHAGATVSSVLQRAYDRLQRVLNEEWAKKVEDLPLTSSYEALILASLIEKETGAAFERPDISGVFIRRLKQRMKLQSDPTVIYGMGALYDGQLNRRMLREKTPYNTYVIRGLPPTPIALVGREAIHAALHPAEGKSLYFVAKGDGTHYFSNSLVEHNRAVRKYQVMQRRSDYRSTVEPDK
ncbi:Endolytic murein transglycosylase [invertebrate metagenome]|uniref:Endolytic murein transglycosylase n=1 Tax=invertebrate metagenome TaxID=1711999 RepID=A0A2H9T9Q3_9ZZZZ